MRKRFGQVPPLLVSLNALQRFINHGETATEFAGFSFGERRSAANMV